jgi:hypothetical protein
MRWARFGQRDMQFWTFGEASSMGALIGSRWRVLGGGAVTALVIAIAPGGANAASSVTPPFTECPAIGDSPSCQILLVANQSQTITVLGDRSVGPYDGTDDTLVGIVNNTNKPISAITVSGTGSDLAGFDGDGICTYAAGGIAGGSSAGFKGDGYCDAQQLDGVNPEDYAGPDNTYTLDPNSQDDVEVDFNGKGLSSGDSTYFSLEGALTAAVITARQGKLRTRYVALGDSIPYGHGIANPYPISEIGLPSADVRQGPSNLAYPELVASALHLTQTVRKTNCGLTGDDLAISGATAASKDTRQGNSQCTEWPGSESLQNNELPNAHLSQHPAAFVTIQAGADDINFPDCMKWELIKIGLYHPEGTQCVESDAASKYFGKCLKWELSSSAAWHVLDPGCVRSSTVKPALVFTKTRGNDIPAELTNIRTALTDEIEQASPYATQIAVLNYYLPIPNPTDFKKTSIFSGGQVDPVCWGLSHNLKGAYNDAVIIQAALNNTIAAAVSNAVGAGIKNVQLVDISNLEVGHEMCTGSPAIFSGQLMPKSQFYKDILFRRGQDFEKYIWRAAHPNVYGQQDIANSIESQLGNL